MITKAIKVAIIKAINFSKSNNNNNNNNSNNNNNNNNNNNKVNHLKLYLATTKVFKFSVQY